MTNSNHEPTPDPVFTEPFPTVQPGESRSAYKIRLAGYTARRDAFARTVADARR